MRIIGCFALWCACLAAEIVSGNVAVDLMGPVDTRPSTWGTADSFTWPLTFKVPAGKVVVIERIQGDVVAWPKDHNGVLTGSGTISGNLTYDAGPRAHAGVLAGFKVSGPDGSIACDLCADNTPLYVQQNVPPEGATRVFRYRLGIPLKDGKLFLKVASWLNTFGVPIHIELTYTIWFHYA